MNQLVFLSQPTWIGRMWELIRTLVQTKLRSSLRHGSHSAFWWTLLVGDGGQMFAFQKCKRKATLTRWSREIFPPHRTESLRLSWCEIPPKLWLNVLIKLSLCLSLQFGSCVKPGLFLPDFPISCDCCENIPLHKRLRGELPLYCQLWRGFLVLDIAFCDFLASHYRKGLQKLS